MFFVFLGLSRADFNSIVRGMADGLSLHPVECLRKCLLITLLMSCRLGLYNIYCLEVIDDVSM